MLGVLGNLKHVQCRDCGAQFSKRVRGRDKSVFRKRKVVKNG